MKLDKKTISIIILILSIAVLLLVYNFVFTKYNEKTEEVQKENVAFTARRDELKLLAAQLPKFKTGIKTEQEKQGIIKSLFPAAVNEENKIMFIDGIEKDPEMDIFFSTISYGTPTQISYFTDEATKTNFTAYEVIMSLTFEGSYEGVNDFIDFVNGQKDRMVVNNISMAFSTANGVLSGTANITMYYIEGLDCSYNPPVVSEIAIGRPNIFGTIS